jgi:acyl-CoA reductase-like NAD-dependent aldehyde dehydrogenase
MIEMQTSMPIINGIPIRTPDFSIVNAPFDGEPVSKLFYSSRKIINEIEEHYSSDITSKAAHEVLKVLGTFLKNNKEYLAKQVSVETGSPLSFTEMQIEESLAFIKDFDKIDVELKEKYVLEPKGTILISIPSNEPISITINSLLPALLFGNRVIVRPSESTPSFTFQVVKKITQVKSFRKAIFYIPARKSMTEWLIANKIIDAVFWTGGGKSVKTIGMLTSMHRKELIAESEGNDWALVDDTYDLEKVARILFKSFTMNNGQMCNAIRGIIVKDSAYDRLVDSLKDKITKIKMGNPLNEDTGIGPLKTKKIVNALINKVKSSKVKYFGLNSKGNLLQPGLILNPDIKNDIIQEGFFGPIAWIKPIKNIKDAVDWYNNLNRHKLCIAVFSNNREILDYVKNKARCTIVHINRSPFDIPYISPWGGRGLSGCGGARSWANKFLDNKLIMH